MRNTKLQNNKNVANNIAKQDSQYLTELLSKEQLPENTEFYVRKKDGKTDTLTWINRKYSSSVDWWNVYGVTKVLAKVPSYDELCFMNNELVAANGLLRHAREQNTKLKEVLSVIKHQCELLLPKNGLNPISSDRAVMMSFLNKINEVLK